MFLSLKAKHVRMAIAIHSVILSCSILAFMNHFVETYKCMEISVWRHVCVLQVIGGIFLFMSGFYSSHWLRLPWVVASCIFIYTLIYKSFVYHRFVEVRLLWVVPLLQIIAVFYSYFVYDVFMGFLQAHSEAIKQISIMETVRTQH
ncbi:uncharacterized protein LOC108112371 [Drosophila eugracilis]|uniref:uncharacterized protein LOC108112371 n=1 Tax=Drosophila eugracilis TaxID=29029 RepID=UPI0007E7CEA5|nr:uncharacterized protein LOC108112371 [Drosophila eugracilis]